MSNFNKNDNSIIKAINIAKAYRVGEDELIVFNNLNLSVKQGDIVSIIGRSGSGKSTLLNILGGLDTPTSGIVEINSININNLNEHELSKFRNKHIGFIFQFHHLLMEFTTIENVIMPGLILGYETESELVKKALSLLERLELISKKNSKPSNLSGGERQRVAIARALINNPEIILADEPTGNLDNQTAEKIKELLIDIIKLYKRTMVIVTHNRSIIQRTDVKYRLEFGSLNTLLDDII